METVVIIPNLGLHDIEDAQLGEFAQDKINKINALGGGSVMAAIVPSTGTVSDKNVAYEAALVKSDDGTRADTQTKNDRRDELEVLLNAQAIDAARLANGNLSLYLSTGYKAKDTKGTPTGPLPAVTGVLLDYGDSAGELKIKWDAMPDAQNFSVQVYTDALNPNTSIVKEYVKPKIGKKETILDSLPSGTIVFARVRANGGSTGTGPWSDPAEKRVP